MTENVKKDGIRLNRYLAQCGLGSRRECDRLISSGVISVNGVKVKELGVIVDPAKDAISHGTRRLDRVLPLEYLAYHKPRGVIVTAADPEGRETIYDSLEKNGLKAGHLKYAGRLDRKSEGLLILSNDGDLLYGLTHPKFNIKKVYQVRVDRRLEEKDMRLMTGEGVASQGQLLKAGKIRQMPSLPVKSGEFWYEVDLYEGKNRQIRRMLEALGYEVLRLKRTMFGVIRLGLLKRGSYRYLAEREVSGLRNLGHRTH